MTGVQTCALPIFQLFAREMNISRTPVREAVQRLVREGLAVEEPRRGAVLVRLGPADLIPIYQMREVLEGLATRLAVENAAPADLEHLKEVHARHEKAVAANDLASHEIHDLELHATIVRLAGNLHLAQALGAIQSKIRVAKVWTAVGGGPELAVQEHARIIEAALTGDAMRAEECARSHIRRLTDALARAAKAK